MPPSAAWSRIASDCRLVDLETEGHRAEADAGDVEAGTAEANVLHAPILPSGAECRNIARVATSS